MEYNAAAGATAGAARELSVELDSLVGAAGGINTVVANVHSGLVDAINTTADLGHDDVNAALARFGTAWTIGLLALCEDQSALADKVRAFAETILQTDLATADRLRAAGQGLETCL